MRAKYALAYTARRSEAGTPRSARNHAPSRSRSESPASPIAAFESSTAITSRASSRCAEASGSIGLVAMAPLRLLPRNAFQDRSSSRGLRGEPGERRDPVVPLDQGGNRPQPSDHAFVECPDLVADGMVVGIDQQRA